MPVTRLLLETGFSSLREDGTLKILEGGVAPVAPDPPTIGTATAGNGSAIVTFTDNGTGGSPITNHIVTSSPEGHTGSGTSPVSVSSLTNGQAYTFSAVAVNAVGPSNPSAASNSVTPSAVANYVMYSDGVMDMVNWPDAQNVSFGLTVQNYGYTTNPKPGHTKSLQVTFSSPSGPNNFGGGWQRSSNWGNIPPSGFDASPYTQVQFSIKIPTGANLYVSQHYTRSTGDDIGTSASATQGSTCFNSIVANTWSDVAPIPLSSLGGLSSYNMYKCNLPGNSTGPVTAQLDDVIYFPGNTGWIFRGRLSGLESGWTDASTATANYGFLPNTGVNAGGIGANCYSINNPPAKASVFNGSVTAGVLTVSSVTSGAIAIGDALFYDSAVKGTITGGSGTTWTITGSPGNRSSVAMGSAPPAKSIPIVKMTVSAANQLWKVTHAGFAVTPYTNFTFGVIRTNAASGFKVQVYDTSGTPVGNLVTMSGTYTIHDWGVSNQYFTVFNVPFAALGAIGSTIGGISIQETNGSNWYHSADGFWS